MNVIHIIPPIVTSRPVETHIHTQHDQEDRRSEDTRIARLTGTELASAIRDGSVTSERTVAAFSRRARSIGLLKTRAIAQELYDEAVETAALIDEAGGVGSMILQGIPISIKDVIHMKGAVRVSHIFWRNFFNAAGGACVAFCTHATIRYLYTTVQDYKISSDSEEVYAKQTVVTRYAELLLNVLVRSLAHRQRKPPYQQ